MKTYQVTGQMQETSPAIELGYFAGSDETAAIKNARDHLAQFFTETYPIMKAKQVNPETGE